ncbi:MAG: dual specificity protein phosphatase [Deltaproteobacteria bacterium]|nr:dual specificity protein phosphatase [Deltaproteobacteria bacterium]
MAIPLPSLSLIARGLDPHGADLFIGGTAAARDVDLLRRHDISTVVNTAVNVDVNYVAAPGDGGENGESNAVCRAGFAPFRVFKLGLVDGENPPGMMLGGYCILHGALRQTMPHKESYPPQARGNVLVHCREGRSRSVALAALYLHLQDPTRFPELEDAVAVVRAKRGLPPEEWFEAPNKKIIDAAAEAARAIRSLRDLGVLAI